MAAVLILLALLLGITASLPVFLATASFIDSPMLLVAMSALVAVVVVTGPTWAALRTLRARRRVARAVGLGAVSGALLFTAMSYFLLRPPPRTVHAPAAGPDVEYWQLPTGSQIAYVKSPAVGEHRLTPVIMLHGGPCAPALPMFQLLNDLRPLDALSALGHDVYYYDQLGCGLSSRLDLRKDSPYTVARHVADLEAIRVAIGADRVILVGHSWGAILASRYMLKYPGRVEKVVFDSPGAITGLTESGQDAGPDASLSPADAESYQRVVRPTLRIATARDLAARNSRAAFHLIPDWEVDQWLEAQAGEAVRLGQLRASCSASVNQSLARTWLGGGSGVGFFGFTQIIEDLATLPDPRPRLREDKTPALVLRGECDNIPWPTALAYRQTFPNARLAPIDGAGHFIWIDETETYSRVIAAFLSDEPLPVSDYAGDNPPW